MARRCHRPVPGRRPRSGVRRGHGPAQRDTTPHGLGARVIGKDVSVMGEGILDNGEEHTGAGLAGQEEDDSAALSDAVT